MQDIADYIKPIIKSKPDIILVYTGANDLTSSVNTMSKERKIVKAVEVMNGNNEKKLGFSNVIARKDWDLEKENKETNKKLKIYCIGKGSIFADNANVKENCLNNSKFHLNRKGTSLFTKTYLQIVFSGFEWNAIRHPAIIDSTNQSSLNQNIPLEKLKELRLDDPKYLTFSYLNINSLLEIVMGKVDILIVAETKIAASFLTVFSWRVSQAVSFGCV